MKETERLLITIKYVNGEVSTPFPVTGDFLDQLHRLRAEGLNGKTLIQELLVTDDGGIPMLGIQIKGRTADGKAVNLWIPYS